jgi:hypothetical protein
MGGFRFCLRRRSQVIVDRLEEHVRVDEFVRIDIAPHAESAANCATP